MVWNGGCGGGKCKVLWPVVCSPKCYGGLGLPDIKVLSFALCLKWEWRKRVVDAPPWTRLPSKPERVVSSMFHSSVLVVLGDGTSAHFCSDLWLPDGPIHSSASHLHHAVGRRFLLVYVKKALAGHRWVRHITGPPMAPVLVEYVEL